MCITWEKWGFIVVAVVLMLNHEMQLYFGFLSSSHFSLLQAIHSLPTIFALLAQFHICYIFFLYHWHIYCQFYLCVLLHAHIHTHTHVTCSFLSIPCPYVFLAVYLTHPYKYTSCKLPFLLELCSDTATPYTCYLFVQL